MKAILIVGAVLIGIYVIAGFIAWNLLPKRLAEAERRLPGIRLAISQILADQKIVSERLNSISSATLGKKQTKADEVAAVLADPELNKLALQYMGADWALQKSAFLGSVAHMRKMLKDQKEGLKDGKSRLNKKIKDLELRKQHLKNKLVTTPSDVRAWRLEYDDIERQLVAFRSSNTYREYIEKDDVDKKLIEGNAKTEDAIHKLASEYLASTVGVLIQTMAEQVGGLRFEECEPMRIRQKMLIFNVWPLNAFGKMPVGN